MKYCFLPEWAVHRGQHVVQLFFYRDYYPLYAQSHRFLPLLEMGFSIRLVYPEQTWLFQIPGSSARGVDVDDVAN